MCVLACLFFCQELGNSLSTRYEPFICSTATVLLVHVVASQLGRFVGKKGFKKLIPIQTLGRGMMSLISRHYYNNKISSKLTVTVFANRKDAKKLTVNWTFHENHKILLQSQCIYQE